MKAISSHIYFDTKSKIHIQKNDVSMDTLCGKNLGFNYEVADGEVDEKDFNSQFCKKCIKKYYLKK